MLNLFKIIKKQKMTIMMSMMITMMRRKRLGIKDLYLLFLNLFIKKEVILIKFGMKLKI
jgi:hypothetical protein